MPRSFSSWVSDHRALQTHFIAYAFFEMHINQKNIPHQNTIFSPFYVTVKTFICKPTGKKYDTNTHTSPLKSFFKKFSSVQKTISSHTKSIRSVTWFDLSGGQFGSLVQHKLPVKHFIFCLRKLQTALGGAANTCWLEAACLIHFRATRGDIKGLSSKVPPSKVLFWMIK